MSGCCRPNADMRRSRLGCGRVPARKVGAIDEFRRPDDPCQLRERGSAVNVGVEPQLAEVGVEPLAPKLLRYPGALLYGAAEPSRQRRDRATAMAQADVQVGVALQHTTEDERADCQRPGLELHSGYSGATG